ncbi:MAG: hypothetical protein HKN98_10105 [Silicimonas sp.]|nr:hypothetical protein [Silicimonas sp.]
MTDAITMLANLRRPRLLIDAAHLGVPEYQRDQTIGRLLPGGPRANVSETFRALAEDEATMNEERRTGGAAYSVARHIELLVAMIVEARLLVNDPA